MRCVIVSQRQLLSELLGGLIASRDQGVNRPELPCEVVRVVGLYKFALCHLACRIGNIRRRSQADAHVISLSQNISHMAGRLAINRQKLHIYHPVDSRLVSPYTLLRSRKCVPFSLIATQHLIRSVFPLVILKVNTGSYVMISDLRS